jgi:hypothetical protein
VRVLACIEDQEFIQRILDNMGSAGPHCISPRPAAGRRKWIS